MSRRSKQARPEFISGGYAAIPWTVLDSISFKGASDKARALLFALMRQHNGNNNGRLHLSKKWLYEHGWTCHENNAKSRNELITRGLIVQTKWGGLNMGTDWFALTWYDINNYVGLDITAKGYSRGAYQLCNLAPTPRRKPPNKKLVLTNDCNRLVPTTVPVTQSHGTTTVPITAHSIPCTGTTTENNVFIPLPTVNSVRPIEGVKGKNGISKQQLQAK